MFSKQTFIITIGNYGSVVALHGKSEIKHKIFIENLNESSQAELKTLFEKNKSTPICILLDTADQIYRKKSYPPVRKGDLVRMVKRDLAADGDKESLKNYIIFQQPKGQKNKAGVKSECLFISTSLSEEVHVWLNFLTDMPNELVGIYMLPIESFNLLKLLKKSPEIQSKITDKQNALYCLILHNKISGIRQVVISEYGVIFTRNLTYNFEDSGFLENYEQDIYSTFEYLKRLSPNLMMSNLNIINIFSAEILTKIKTIENVELKIINYTPSEAAKIAGYAAFIPQNSNFCDMLISKIFSTQKKILKFTTPKIVTLGKFFYLLKFSRYLNIFFIAVICGFALFAMVSIQQARKASYIAEQDKIHANDEFTKIKNPKEDGNSAMENGKVADIERVIDLGKIDEALSDVGINVIDFYKNLSFLKDLEVKLSSFNYSLINLDGNSPTNVNYKITFAGDLNNKSGDIDDLFQKFDLLTSIAKKTLGADKVSYNEIPRNIDFNKKYYTFPVNFSVAKDPGALTSSTDIKPSKKAKK